MGKKVYKRLDIEDRMIIQACLHDHRTLEQIATRIGVSKSTISRELNRNATLEPGPAIRCATLKKLIVCNACRKKAHCHKQRRYYNFKWAQESTSSRNHLARSIPKLTVEAIKDIDHIVTDGVRLGQSLHHIYVGDKHLQQHCCERTIRRLVYRGNLSIRPHQLRRYVRFKHEYKKEAPELQLRDIRAIIGRTYKDYVRYCDRHRGLNIVQYDSLVGKIDDKQAILTITFPSFNFQFGLIIQKGSPVSVNHALRKLFALLGDDTVKKVFPINLCDNGVECSYFHRLEADEHGQVILRTFYTNPYRSTDKAEAERNHEFVRYCLPKGKSLDQLTQQVLDDMFSHINSYTRKSKHDKTPYDMVKARFGKQFLDAIKIVHISNKKVKLLPIV